MSLLGISLDPALAKARQDSSYGYVTETRDEELLKAIGAIVLEKGSWVVKYKKEEILGLLEWIIDGKKAENLPSLAKRLLCLKREKLMRGIKDAGTANYARAYENKWVKEIDAIFAAAKAPVECVVDIVKESCDEKPVKNGEAAAPAATAGSSTGKGAVTKPPGGIVSTSGQSGPPKPPGPPPASPAVVPKSGEAPPSSEETPAPAAPAAPGSASVAPSNATVEQSVTTTHETLPVRTPNTTGPGGKPPIAEVEPANSLYTDIIPGVTYYIPMVSPERQIGISLIVEKLVREGETKPELQTKVQTVLDDETKSDSEKIDTLVSDLKITPPTLPPSPNSAATPDAVVSAVKEAVKAVVGPRKYVSTDKINYLQQLVYATCGTASIFDPLIDYLNKLDATIRNTSMEGSTIKALSEKNAALKELITKGATELASTSDNAARKAGLKTRLSTLRDELSGANEDKKLLIESEIDHIQSLLDQTDPQLMKAQLISELQEEKRLLESLLFALDSGDSFIETLKRFRSEVDGQLSNLSSSNASNVSNTITAACSQRAVAYREELENARAKVKSDSETAIARVKKECEEKLTAAETAHTEEVTRLKDELESTRSNTGTEINELTAELKLKVAELVALTKSCEEQKIALAAANQAKTEIASSTADKDARISALSSEIEELKGKLGELTQLETLKAQLADAQAKLTDCEGLRAALAEAEAAQKVKQAAHNAEMKRIKAECEKPAAVPVASPAVSPAPNNPTSPISVSEPVTPAERSKVRSALTTAEGITTRPGFRLSGYEKWRFILRDYLMILKAKSWEELSPYAKEEFDKKFVGPSVPNEVKQFINRAKTEVKRGGTRKAPKKSARRTRKVK